MTGDCHVRFCESLGVRFPRATHPYAYVNELSIFDVADMVLARTLRLSPHTLQ